MRLQTVVILLIALTFGYTTSANAQTQGLSARFTCSPELVRPGDVVTATLTLVNRGTTDLRNVGAYIGIPLSFSALGSTQKVMEFRSVTTSSGWTAVGESVSELPPSFELKLFAAATLPAGGSATLVAEVVVGTDMWPGAEIPLIAQPPTALGPLLRTSVGVRGSASFPTTTSQLFGDGTRTARTFPLEYDPLNEVYLASTTVGLVSTDTQGNPVSQPIALEGSIDSGSLRTAYSPHLTNGLEPGGAMMVWTRSFGAVHAQPITSRGASLAPSQLLPGSEHGRNPAVAYSATSRRFLVVWSRCDSFSPCSVVAMLLGLDGQPAGLAFDIGLATPGGDTADVAWNPQTNEFGVTSHAGFARISAGGTIRGRTTAFGGVTIAVNSQTGNYLVVAPRFGGTFGIEINSAGRVVSRGTMWKLSPNANPFFPDYRLSYNAASGTFLLSVFEATVPSIVELNKYGSPLTMPANICAGSTVSRSDAPEWGYAAGGPSPNCPPYATILTLSRDGGSEMRLGGCTSPDPFVSLGGGHCYDGGWLPPGIDPPFWTVPASVTCAGPDPFVALGGGTCSNGGWLPPGMPPAPPSQCTIPDPFVSLGGGTCVNGGWLPPGMATPAPPAAPAPSGCSIPDPFVSLGGGICRNGGWIPRGLIPSQPPD
jgi:hypothetical protein